MQKLTFFLAFLFLASFNVRAQADANEQPQYEVKIITSVESIVPLGLGRSRLIITDAERNYEDFTSERTEEDQSKNKSKRKDIRVKEFEETKLLNFYSATGIRFQNIAANDALVASKLTDMITQGWDLVFVTSAVESDAGETDGDGIFITRYIFKRPL